MKYLERILNQENHSLSDSRENCENPAKPAANDESDEENATAKTAKTAETTSKNSFRSFHSHDLKEKCDQEPNSDKDAIADVPPALQEMPGLTLEAPGVWMWRGFIVPTQGTMPAYRKHFARRRAQKILSQNGSECDANEN